MPDDPFSGLSERYPPCRKNSLPPSKNPQKKKGTESDWNKIGYTYQTAASAFWIEKPENRGLRPKCNTKTQLKPIFQELKYLHPTYYLKNKPSKRLQHEMILQNTASILIFRDHETVSRSMKLKQNGITAVPVLSI